MVPGTGEEQEEDCSRKCGAGRFDGVARMDHSSEILHGSRTVATTVRADSLPEHAAFLVRRDQGGCFQSRLTDKVTSSADAVDAFLIFPSMSGFDL